MQPTRHTRRSLPLPPCGTGAGLVVLAVVLGLAPAGIAADPPPGVEPVGGRWFVRTLDAVGQDLDPPVYLWRDTVDGAETYLDLFSYHARDANGDGIDDIRLRHEPPDDGRSGFLVIESQGYPNHPTAEFPNSDNPNPIRVQEFVFRLPLEPRVAESITRLPMGPIGTALNGVVFFNPFEQEGMNAVEGYSEVWLDACCGHPQQTGIYHYHKYPSCVKSPFKDDGHRHSPVIGFAWDGFPVCGPYEADGLMARDLDSLPSPPAPPLDVCNGHEDPERGYHYHVTPNRFPYILGGYRGVPEPSNSRGLRRGAGIGPLEDNTRGESRLEGVIAEVLPGSVRPGGKRTVTVRLDPSATNRREVPRGKPSWVQIGPFEAVSIDREGDDLTVVIDVPEDAPRGVLLDAHVEFAGAGQGGRARVFKRNDVLRVVD